MEFDLVRAFRRPVFEYAQAERGERASRIIFRGEFDDFRAGVEFLFHGYRILKGFDLVKDFFNSS
jgi:hypothetical protein